VQGKQVFAITMAAVLLLATGTHIPAQQDEPGNIVEIQVTGNRNIGRDAILSAIDLAPGMPFDRQKMQEARNAIDRMGFFQVVSAREEPAPGGVRVVFEVVENPVVTAIVFRGNTVVSEQELLDAMRTKAGQVYNINTLEQDLRDIENLYARKQYLAYVTNEAEIDPATGVLTLPIMEFRV